MKYKAGELVYFAFIFDLENWTNFPFILAPKQK